MQQEKQTRRRVYRSDDEKRELLAEWKKSGVSAREFSSRTGIKPSCLWRWKRAAREHVTSTEVRPQRPITFAPVHVTKSAPSMSAASGRVQAEVLLGRELRVRVFEGADVVQVGRLIQALAGGAAC